MLSRALVLQERWLGIMIVESLCKIGISKSISDEGDFYCIDQISNMRHFHVNSRNFWISMNFGNSFHFGVWWFTKFYSTRNIWDLSQL